MRKLAITLSCAAALAGCHGRLPPSGPIALAEDGGAAYVYWRSPAGEAAKLKISLTEIRAVREDGASVPLPLLRPEVGGAEAAGSQRLVAAGGIPSGRYSGLSLRFSGGERPGEEGREILPAPGEPSRISIPFSVDRGRGVVIVLLLRSGELVAEGTFAPAFSAEIPAKPAAGLIGLVTGRRAGVVLIFDKIAGAIAGVVPAGRLPGGIALDPILNRAYVALAGDDLVEALDFLQGSVIDRLQLAGGDEPAELALTPDGRTLLSVNAGSHTVSVIDARSLFETGRIAVGEGPQSLVIDSSGRRAYVFNTLSSSVTVVDVPSASVAATLATDAGPLRGQLDRRDARLYVIHQSAPYLTVIDTAALAVSRRVYVGAGATALKVDPRTDRIYLARRGTDQVEIFDPLSFLPLDSIPTPGSAAHLAIDGEGNNLYLALPEAREVRIVRIAGHGTVADIETGDEPYRVAVMGGK